MPLIRSNTFSLVLYLREWKCHWEIQSFYSNFKSCTDNDYKFLILTKNEKKSVTAKREQVHVKEEEKEVDEKRLEKWSSNITQNLQVKGIHFSEPFFCAYHRHHLHSIFGIHKTSGIISFGIVVLAPLSQKNSDSITAVDMITSPNIHPLAVFLQSRTVVGLYVHECLPRVTAIFELDEEGTVLVQARSCCTHPQLPKTESRDSDSNVPL